REHEAARRQAAEERDGRWWHLGLRKELKEAIQPEHDEDDTEQDSRDQHSSLHWISSLAPRLRGGMAPRRPAAASSIACRISARLFMTNGPYCTIGSRSGAPAMRRTRDGSSVRSTTPSAAGLVVRIPVRPAAIRGQLDVENHRLCDRLRDRARHAANLAGDHLHADAALVREGRNLRRGDVAVRRRAHLVPRRKIHPE